MNPPANEQLYLRCLSYLEREEALQEQLLELAQTIRRCLVQGDLNRLQATLRMHADLRRVRQELDHERRELTSDAAVQLRLPVEQPVRLRQIARALPDPWGAELLEQADRLQRLVTEIDQINIGNALLVRHHQELLRQVLYQLTGEQPAGETYAPHGQEGRALQGVLLRTQG